MKKRIGNPPKGVKYPVWDWYLYEGKNKRPNMRKSDVRVSEKSVLGEVEISDSEVLLTNEEAWHSVLNDNIYYKANNMVDISDEQWYMEAENEDKYFNSLSPEEKILYKETSWENIICLPNVDIPYAQATFLEFKASQIKKLDLKKIIFKHF